MGKPVLVCLLPVRNGEDDLPGFFASAARFADAVIALDDGSTDRTRELLDASPLVHAVLANPRREDYAGWDDAANRNRLLAAAAELEPAWIISLDADERIPADDAAALRAFLETEALPDFAYGFKVYRMWQDLGQYDRAGLWVYRLFAWAAGQRFPEQRLHFVPIPTAIPRERWLRTTIRIQHLAGLTAERRAARFEKYRQADPNNAFQHSYRDLLELPEETAAWEPRPADLPILDVSATEVDTAIEETTQPPLAEIGDRPALSAIIISRDDGDRLLRTVGSVVNQDCPWPFEVIVVTSGKGTGAALVRERFPDVIVVDLPRPVLPGEARNAGLCLARGEFVSFPGSHVELPQGSLAARMRAHDLGYAMVTGTMLNGTRTWAGWASYFLDHSAALPGRPSTELQFAPGSCSYRRAALLRVGGFPEDLRAGEDTVVNQELVRRGYQAYRAKDVVLFHRSPCRTPWRLLRHHFVRGRGLGRIRRERDGVRRRDLLSPFGLRLIWQQTALRILQTTRNVRNWGGESLVAEYRRAFPMVVAGVLAAAAGSVYEVLRPHSRRADRRTDHPVSLRSISNRAGSGSSQNDRVSGREHAALLPEHRIVAYYGHPVAPAMGVLGNPDREAMLAGLRDLAAQYAAADPSRSVLPALELVAVTARRDAGHDGAYRTRISPDLLDIWADLASQEGLLLILDVQPGRSPCAKEIAALRKWLVLPHVHLALDAEWAVGEGEIPGQGAGCLTASQIQAAQETLASLVESAGLPPKLLIVHQYDEELIVDKASLRSAPQVQLVIDADGHGDPRHKTDRYHALLSEHGRRGHFAGIKLFYKKDKPLLTPEQVIALLPSPDLVVYQ